MRRMHLALALAVVIGLAGMARGQAFLKNGDEILCVGDSITEQGIYQRQLEQALHTLYPEATFKVVNLGKSGAWADWQIKPLQDYLTKNKPTVITTMFGVNDTKWDSKGIEQRAEAFVANLRKYPPIAKQAGAELVFLRETDFGHDLTGDDYVKSLSKNLALLQKAQTAMAEADGIPIIDCHGAFKRALGRAWEEDPKWEFTPDIIHPNSAGHAAVTGEMLRAFGAGMNLAADKRGALNLKGNPNISLMVVSGAGEVAVGGKVPVGIDVTNRNEQAIDGTLIVVAGSAKVTVPVKVPAGEGVHLKLALPAGDMKDRWDVVPLYMTFAGSDTFAAETSLFTFSHTTPKLESVGELSTRWGNPPPGPCPVKDVSAVRTKQGLELAFMWKDTTPVPAEGAAKNRYGQSTGGPLDLGSRGVQPCDAFEVLLDLRPPASAGRSTANCDANPTGVVRVALYKDKQGDALVTKLATEPAKFERASFKEESGDRYVIAIKLAEDSSVAFALRVTDQAKYVMANRDGSGWVTAADAIIGQQQPSYYRMGKESLYYRIGW